MREGDEKGITELATLFNQSLLALQSPPDPLGISTVFCVWRLEFRFFLKSRDSCDVLSRTLMGVNKVSDIFKERNNNRKYAQHYSYDLYNSYHVPVTPYQNAQGFVKCRGETLNSSIPARRATLESS